MIEHDHFELHSKSKKRERSLLRGQRERVPNVARSINPLRLRSLHHLATYLTQKISYAVMLLKMLGSTAKSPFSFGTADATRVTEKRPQ